jgi:hypothetical protein
LDNRRGNPSGKPFLAQLSDGFLELSFRDLRQIVSAAPSLSGIQAHVEGAFILKTQSSVRTFNLVARKSEIRHQPQNTPIAQRFRRIAKSGMNHLESSLGNLIGESGLSARDCIGVAIQRQHLVPAQVFVRAKGFEESRGMTASA